MAAVYVQRFRLTQLTFAYVFFVVLFFIIFKMQEKGHNVLVQFKRNLDFGH